MGITSSDMLPNTMEDMTRRGLPPLGLCRVRTVNTSESICQVSSAPDTSPHDENGVIGAPISVDVLKMASRLVTEIVMH